MAPGDKARAAGVSSSSFLDLKAELAIQENEYTKKGSKTKGTGKEAGNKGRGTIWARTNKGIAARRERDIASMAADRTTSESTRAALERKAEIYSKLKRGMTGGLTDAQMDALLVDFDAREDGYDSDSDDYDDSLTAPKPTDNDDPLVEYEDEFGRMRTARRSEVPRNLRPPEEVVEEDPYLEFNPINHFPVYEPSADRVAAIQEAASETANPLETHYDASRENRAKGAAFYTFSKDEEQRAKEMEALKQAREETERTRKDRGAVDIRPGEGEGLAGPDGGVMNGDGGEKSKKSRAMDKRKREIGERRKLVEAKKRKLKGLPEVEEKSEASSSSLRKTGEANDSFAALEAQTRKALMEVPSSSDTGKKSRMDEETECDDDATINRKAAGIFLAKLELDHAFQKAQG